ncbi:MAG: choice-of-anchor J domain-containing protein [Dysgonamonadaceae bacterium]|jgi:hypothetical protein|nr:choice-of-anchor J domain-containing protein [Dysgonamonadaceae bacterium]
MKRNLMMLIWMAVTSFCYPQSGEWMSYDDGTYFGKVSFDGTNTISTYDIAIKYTSEDIRTIGFTEIRSVKIYNELAPPPKSVYIKIWKGTNAATEVVSKQYTPEDGWNEIALDAPYTVDASQDLWIGVRYESIVAAHSHACMDTKLNYPGKSNWKRPIVNGIPGVWITDENQIGDWNIQFFADGFQVQESEILIKSAIGQSENALFYHNGVIYTSNWTENVGLLHGYVSSSGTDLVLSEEKEITGLPQLEGAPNFYGFASDGKVIYAVNQTRYIYVIDPVTFSLQKTIETAFDEYWGGPVTIAYDAGLDGFWCSFVHRANVVFIRKDGTLTDLTLEGSSKVIMGLTYDDVSAGGPYLWASTGELPEDNFAKIGRWNLQTGVFTEGIKDVPDIMENAANENYIGSIYLYQDINTGKQVLAGVLASQSLLFAYDLYNTFDPESPAKVDNFSFTPESSGALEATLSWKNPAKKINGSDLSNLTGIKIYRDDQLVHTASDPTVGEEQSWTDVSIPESKIYSYKVVAVNSVGEGVPAIRASFVGQDIPGKVSNLVLAKENNTGKLTWTAPVKGEKDGWINQNALVYKIVRLPDEITVAENIQGTAYTDNTVSVLDVYSYTVTAKNTVGESQPVTSNAIPLGISIPVPWQETFSKQERFTLWTIINENQDYDTWAYNPYSGEGSAQCASAENDDWLISPAIALESGEKYNLRWSHSLVGTQESQSHYELYIGKNVTVESQTNLLGSYNAVYTENFQYVENNVEITVPESGNYHFAWYCDDRSGESGTKGISIDDISLNYFNRMDLAATAITGPNEINAETDTTFIVTVKNKGFVPASQFEVGLLVYADDNIPDKKDVITCSDVLNPGEQRDFRFSFNYQTPVDVMLKAAVTIANDEDVSNDTTRLHSLKIYPKGSEKVSIGDFSSIIYQQLTPFNCFYEKNAAQSLYYEEEIGAQGVINALEYYYSAQPGESVHNKPVQIYMAITQEEDLYEGWIIKDTVLVYDGFLNLPDNKQSVTIFLQKPFVYTGGNLMIYTVSSDTKSYYPYTQFQCTSNDRFRSRVIADRYTPFNFTQTGRVLGLVANISLIMNKKGASLNGTVTDSNQNPVANATVTLDEKSWKTTTDANGRYEFAFVPENTACTVIASKAGYRRDVQTGTMSETDLVFDFALTACEVNPVRNLDEISLIPGWDSGKYSYLSWEQPDDMEGNSVTAYQVYINSELKAKLPADVFSYLNAVSQGNYVYEVSAVWSSGCESITLAKNVEVLPDTVITEYPFLESFESGQIATFWQEKHLQNNSNWEIISEKSDAESSFTAHSGQYFAVFCDDDHYMSTTRLITPQFDFSDLPEPYLSFWHIQAVQHFIDRDILTVSYKNTPEGKWKKLIEYDEDIESWKKEVIKLPEPSATYRIAFESIAKFGYGVMLDDVKVSDVNGTNAIPSVGKDGSPTVAVFPNPANTTLTVRGENIKQAEIYNILGQIVETIPFQGEKRRDINVINYESGFYLVKIYDLNGKSGAHRILIQGAR